MNLSPVVILSYYFPPHGGAGTQRFAKFAQHLPAFGYRPIVVTSDDKVTPESALAQDESLLADIGEHTRVIRITDPSPSPADLVRSKLRLNVDLESWAAAAERTLIKTIRDTGARVFIITCSPYAAAAIGDRVRDHTGAKFVLDLRDPWALEGWRTYPTPIHAVRDRTAMIRAIRNADAIIANTPASRDAFIEAAAITSQRVVTIPNGFDATDFSEDVAPASGPFRIVHVGTLHAVTPPERRLRHALRTRHRDIDETARSGRYLFEAIARLTRERPEIAKSLQLDLIGHVDPSHEALAQSLGISSLITCHGYLPHRAAVAAMQAADLIFVPLHALHSRDPELIVPGKLYEALASGRPVLACVPEGDAARLVRASEGGVVCPPDDPAKIASAIAAAFDARATGHPWPGADRSSLAAFERASLTRRLAHALDAVVRRSPLAIGPDPFQIADATARQPVIEIRRRNAAPAVS